MFSTINIYIFTLTIASVTVLLLIAGLAWADRPHSRTKTIFILLCFSGAGFLIDAMPGELPPPRLYEVIGKFMSAPHLGLLWWLSLSILKENFRLNTSAWLGMIVSTAIFSFYLLGDVGLAPEAPKVVDYASALMEPAILLHIMWVSFSGWREDLINTRRMLRLIIVLLPASALLLLNIASFYFDDYKMINLIRVAYLFPISVFWLFWLMRFQSSQLSFVPSPATGTDVVQNEPQDSALFKRLTKVMEEDKAYLEPELTISKLAEHVGIPTHHLRTLINQEMGFRNFSQFLASYRVKDIKVVLADPEQARLPILTLALNGGFSSLSTFNRTFRAETGQSAGEFRKAALGDVAQNLES